MKLVILDRDGVINHDSPHFVKSQQEWVPLPGSVEAIDLLKQRHITVAVATNQSGIARGLLSLDTLRAIHNRIPADHIFYCPHGPDDTCFCRKPKPGLLIQALKKYAIAPQDACMIGDSMRDIQAAIAAQCEPILVLTGNGEKTWADNKSQLKGIQVYADLMDCIQQRFMKE